MRCGRSRAFVDRLPKAQAQFGELAEATVDGQCVQLRERLAQHFRRKHFESPRAMPGHRLFDIREMAHGES